MSSPINVYSVSVNGFTHDITFVSIPDLFDDIGVVSLSDRPETADVLIEFIRDVEKSHEDIIEELGVGNVSIHESVSGVFHSDASCTAEAIAKCILNGDIDSTK